MREERGHKRSGKEFLYSCKYEENCQETFKLERNLKCNEEIKVYVRIQIKIIS